MDTGRMDLYTGSIFSLAIKLLLVILCLYSLALMTCDML